MFGYFRKSRIDKRASKNHRNQTAIHRQAPRSAYCIYLYNKSKLVPSVFKSDKIILYRALSVASYYVCPLMSARQIKKLFELKSCSLFEPRDMINILLTSFYRSVL